MITKFARPIFALIFIEALSWGNGGSAISTALSRAEGVSGTQVAQHSTTLPPTPYKIRRDTKSKKESSNEVSYAAITTTYSHDKKILGHITTLHVISGMPEDAKKLLNNALSYDESEFLNATDCRKVDCGVFNAEYKIAWVTPAYIAITSEVDYCSTSARCNQSWKLEVYDISTGELLNNTHDFKLALWALKYLKKEHHYQSLAMFRWCDQKNSVATDCFFGAGVDPISLFPRGAGMEVYASAGIQDHTLHVSLGFVPLNQIPANLLAGNDFWTGYARKLKVEPAKSTSLPILTPICEQHDSCLPEIKERYETYLKAQETLIETDQSEETLNTLRLIDNTLTESINSCEKKAMICLNGAVDAAILSLRDLGPRKTQ